MTEADADAIGPDGTVRLRCYLPSANSLWFAAGCQGCSHSAPIGIRAAIALMGSRGDRARWPGAGNAGRAARLGRHV